MKIAAQMFCTVLVLGLVVWWAGPRELWAALAAANIGWLAAMTFCVLCALVVGALSVFVVTRALSPSLGSGLIVRSYLRSFAVGMFAPSKFGELTYSHYLTKADVSHGLGLAVLVVDKTISFTFLAFAGSIGILIHIGQQQAVVAVACSIVVVLTMLVALRSPQVRHWVRRHLLRDREKHFSGFSRYLSELLTHRRALACNVALTLLRMLTLGGAIQMGFRSFEVRLDLLTVVMMLAGVQLVSWIPITLSGLGLSHGSAALLFSACCGVDKQISVDLFLINSALSYGLAGIVSLVLGLADN